MIKAPFSPENEEEREQLTILYRMWVRIFYSDYEKKIDTLKIQKNTILGIYIPLLDYVAEKKIAKAEDLRNMFFEFDSVLNELKDGCLIEQQSKHNYKLNPSFFVLIEPVVIRMMQILKQQTEKSNHGKLICFNCKKHDPMFEQLRKQNMRLSCSYCHSNNIHQQQIDIQQVKRCDNLKRKLQRWQAKKIQIQKQIQTNRQNVLNKQKQITEGKIYRNYFDELTSKIPNKRLISQKQQKQLIQYYENQYVQFDYVMKMIAHENDWITKLKKIRANRR